MPVRSQPQVNHFPHSRQLTRKDLLKRHLQRALLPGSARGCQTLGTTCASTEGEVMPLTFALPAEYNAFAMVFAEARSSAKATGEPNIWIMKPTGGGASRGRRITLLDDISGVCYGESIVLQRRAPPCPGPSRRHPDAHIAHTPHRCRYIHRPLLLDGFKFDLRLYVLVTSFNPLECFIYGDGFGRFASERYTSDPARLDNLYVHLTNSSIQKERPTAAERNEHLDSEEGSKCRLLSYVAEQLRRLGVDWEVMWEKIKALVLRSLLAVQDAIPHQRNSFELFGYDVLIDEGLKPWLIEVNASPSLARDNALDREVKDALLADTLEIVTPPYYDRAVWQEMVRWRLDQRAASEARRPARGVASAPSFEAELNALLHAEVPTHCGVCPDCPPSLTHASSRWL